MADRALAWSMVPIAYLSKLLTVRPRAVAAFSISCAMARGNRSLRARMAMLVTSGAARRTMSTSGVVSVALGVKVPNRNL